MLGHGLSGGPIIESFRVYTFSYCNILLELFCSRPLMVLEDNFIARIAQGYPYMILSMFANIVSVHLIL